MLDGYHVSIVASVDEKILGTVTVEDPSLALWR